jgi:hypothetical protein
MPRRTRKSTRTPAEIRAWRKKLSDRCDAFLARNDAESLTFAKIDGGFYSDKNAALIATTAEDAGLDWTQITAVGSYGRWQAVGRQVRKGAHALRVWAPAGSRTEDGPDDAAGQPTTHERRFFKPVAVFAYEQTDPIEDEVALADAETARSHARTDARFAEREGVA